MNSVPWMEQGKGNSMTKKLALAAAMVLAAAGMANAQSGPNTIEVRQVAMALLGANFAGIRGVVAAKGEVKTLENPAKAMARFAGIVPSLFPAGTAAGSNTKATPEVFSDAAGFKTAAMALGTAATALAEAAKAGDADAVAAQIKAVGDSCGNCHKTYRAK